MYLCLEVNFHQLYHKLQMAKVYLPTTSETVAHSVQHYPQVWPYLPSLQGLVLHLLSTQASSNR